MQPREVHTGKVLIPGKGKTWVGKTQREEDERYAHKNNGMNGHANSYLKGGEK
jgi:hypothetical protein